MNRCTGQNVKFELILYLYNEGVCMLKQIIYNYLVENNILSTSDAGIALNSITLQDRKEVLISGNKRGLILLADYLVEIALSENGNEHIHLDKDNFFDDANIELIIEKS